MSSSLGDRVLAYFHSAGLRAGDVVPLELELASELVLLHLQPSLEVLVEYADRIETALLAQGWRRIDPCPPTKERA